LDEVRGQTVGRVGEEDLLDDLAARFEEVASTA
jgi:hypothetical protein